MKGRIQRPDRSHKSALPIVGNIKCGIKGDKFPQSVDYFIPSGKYESLFKAEYGAKPSTIQVVFISNEIRDSCNERFEYRDKKGHLFAHGDGDSFEIWNPKKEKYETRTIEEVPDIMDKVKTLCPDSNKGWEVILTLRFIIPKIRGIAGLWQFSTKGKDSTIPSIVNTFDSIIDHKGSVIGIVFDLSVKFAKSQKPGATSRFPVVSLVPNISDSNMELLKGSFVNPDQKLIT